MYSMVIFVLDDVSICQDLLDAWENAGIIGVTILESSGLGRVRKAGMRDDLPLFPSMQDIYKSSETHHRTLFTVVDGQEPIDAILAATESVIGDLDQPNTGFLVVLPVSQVYGMSRLN